ncbi:uncharacterized protein LOC107303988 [Oryza brachyantha]|uniref:uncharacterized protein LOC107303988 n=1 Tax=Oryza brachyantha TaxID=4533 RepID=UPI00077605FD|nr:uncharacterized protein LOC107303988 [Oryza brachyantha]
MGRIARRSLVPSKSTTTLTASLSSLARFLGTDEPLWWRQRTRSTASLRPAVPPAGAAMLTIAGMTGRPGGSLLLPAVLPSIFTISGILFAVVLEDTLAVGGIAWKFPVDTHVQTSFRRFVCSYKVVAHSISKSQGIMP